MANDCTALGPAKCGKRGQAYLLPCSSHLFCSLGLNTRQMTDWSLPQKEPGRDSKVIGKREAAVLISKQHGGQYNPNQKATFSYTISRGASHRGGSLSWGKGISHRTQHSRHRVSYLLTLGGKRKGVVTDNQGGPQRATSAPHHPTTTKGFSF